VGGAESRRRRRYLGEAGVVEVVDGDAEPEERRGDVGRPRTRPRQLRHQPGPGAAVVGDQLDGTDVAAPAAVQVHATVVLSTNHVVVHSGRHDTNDTLSAYDAIR